MNDGAAALAKRLMNADEFLAWAVEQVGGRRYELVAGEVVAMSPERVGHARVKNLVWLSLRTALREGELQCEALGDGLSVRIDSSTVYEPDALVRCGERVDGEVVEIDDPVIVVEVVSPSSVAVDKGAKLEDYFRLPSVRHYLIVRTRKRTVIHHARAEGDRIETRIVRSGALHLDPPGLTVEVESFFES
jgi:Uma2 family endonuclease